MERRNWEDICASDEYVGRWIALANCVYDDAGKASEGTIVDSDADLVELCTRLGADAQTKCDIVFCSKRDHERNTRPGIVLEQRRSSFPPPAPRAR